MKTPELKKQIIDRINETNSEQLLADIYRWLELTGEKDKPAYIFTEEENKELDSIAKDVEAGKYLTKDKADKEIKKWLGK
ncbi:MAG: hypothetical protein M0D57_12805 [Sphingobacteriales bacterium JAD_PAG50586_3]|nr:MAG: hypothetical protein M0D57_12805 [Sphingobacteriales bacterium JAD_PAG50586_3]